MKRNFLKVSLMMLLLMITGCSKKDEPILHVGEYPVTLEQFGGLMEKEKAEVYNYFTTVHQVQPGDLKWDEKYKEDIPVDMLIEKTTDKILQDIFVLQKAKEEGIIEDDSQKSVKEQWQQESQGSKDDEIVYGPTEKEYYEYYDYYMADLENKVKKILFVEEQISEEELSDHYEKTKDENYRKGKQWDAYRCYVSIEQKDQLYKYHQRVQSTENLLDLIEEMKREGISVENIDSRPESEHYNMSVFPELIKEIGSCSEGQSTEIHENTELCEFAIVQKVSFEQYYNLDEVRETVVHEVEEEVFRKRLEAWKKQNNVKETKSMKKMIKRYLEED